MSESLLSNCLHDTTQNDNESLNGLIRKCCPKDIFVGRDTLNMGCCSAIINFNDGLRGIIDVFDKLNLKSGHYTNTFCENSDNTQITSMENKTTDKQKHRRKQIRAVRKGLVHKEEEEMPSYGAGEFWYIFLCLFLVW